MFARSHGQRWLAITDFIAPLVPLGWAPGGSAISSMRELWGRATDVPVGDGLPATWTTCRDIRRSSTSSRSKASCCSACCGGFRAKPRPRGAVSALFLIGYGIVSVFVEFTREPDSFLGLLALGLSMGQWLSLPMVVAGLLLLGWSYRRA